MVITQEPAQSLPTLNRPVAADVRTTREQQDVALPLVIPLGMEMVDIFAQGSPQRALAKEDHLGQALLLHRPDPALRIGIQVRAATETVVKRVSLADYRVVYFATHGLVAGDIKGLAEPSLALSIPAQSTAEDDGLLTASEIAQLKLNADWVVLSACNTIAGDKPGAEALSGLAPAFFYAGASMVSIIIPCAT